MDTSLRMKGDGSAIVGANYGGQVVYWFDSTGVQVFGVGELWGNLCI
jgi:hypothetical protein